MPDSWQVVASGVLTAAIVALMLLILDGASGRNLAISVALGLLAAGITWWRLRRL